MNKNYFISVVINCHNGENFIEESINSVLNQSFKNFEIIFFDNASTDKTQLKVELFLNEKIKYFKIDNKIKLYKARNLALEKCSGELISFLDVDDLWLENKLKFQHELFQTNPSLGICYTNYFTYNEIKKTRKVILKNFPKGNVFDDLIKNNFINMSTLMIKREALNHLDYIFNENYEIIGDYDLTIRLSRHVHAQGIHYPLSIYRWHGQNLSLKKRLNIIELLNWYNRNKNKKILENKENQKFMQSYIFYLMIRYFLSLNKKKKAISKLWKISNLRLFFLSLFLIICPTFFFRKITN